MSQPCKPKLPSEALRQFLYSPRRTDVRFDKANNRFWYKVAHDQWARAYGLTYMLAHAFWPDYDRNHPLIQAGIDTLKRQERAKQQKQQQHRAKTTSRGHKKGRKAPRGYKTTAEVEALARATPRDRLYGMSLGELVHRQLHVWAMDRYRGTRHFGTASTVEWPPHRWTQGIREALVQLGVDVRYGELLLYDARIPLGTSVDLVGWSRTRKAVVLIEVKTGSKWNMEMGSGPMKGRTAAVLQFNNSPLNQAIVQLAITHAVVEGFYEIPRAEGLLLWANDRVGVQARWLDARLKRAGRILASELHRHLELRGGKAWAEPKGG